MPTQPALVRPQRLRSARTQRFVSPVKCPTVGQCFDIEVTQHDQYEIITIKTTGKPAISMTWNGKEPLKILLP